MAVEKFFDLARIDILTAADQHVLQPACDVAIAFLVHDRQVSAMHPAIGVDRHRCAFFVTPIPLHDGITARAKFALLAWGHGSTSLIDNFAFHMRLDTADCRNTFVQWLVSGGLEGVSAAPPKQPLPEAEL